ncbi:MAG TPA: hypothetical protein VLW50_00260 [Streptosporangiaceae bacterium]|nr:hypothetical protein [Streptosporangiaceae bacterium]
MLVNLFRERIGAPMRPDAIGELIAAGGRRAGLDLAVTPHQLQHAYVNDVLPIRADAMKDRQPGHLDPPTTEVSDMPGGLTAVDYHVARPGDA